MVVISDPTVLRGIAEFYENEVGEAIIARTESLATFRELGPPDLCHIIKTNPKALVKDLGSYHYVLGVDSSSSATLAAYLNSLSYSIGPVNPKQPNPWKLRSGTYCCFNAFSRVDVRVEVRIPGGVESYAVDLRGDKHPITNPALWQETFVSAILRAILDDNDEPDGNDGRPLLGLRKLDPLPTLSVEKRFLDAAAAEFWKGWQLGTEPEVQVATYFSNHLTNGVMKYFTESGRLNMAARFLEGLFEKDAEVAAALARSYIGDDDEIRAVKTLFDGIKRMPHSYGILLVQVDFLKSKGKLDMAAKLAKMAVTASPSEYVTWAKLADIYIQMGDYESALLALNSCPMFTYCEKDAQRMPPPARIHLPLKPETPDKDPSPNDAKAAAAQQQQQHGTIYDDNDPRESEVHPELQRLPALSLRGTFAKAYALLIRIVGKIGWDALLKHRSKVFVMEEEYRIQRALVEEGAALADDEEDNRSARPQGEVDLLGVSENSSALPKAVLKGDEKNEEKKEDLIAWGGDEEAEDKKGKGKASGLSEEEAAFFMNGTESGDKADAGGFESVALDGPEETKDAGLTIDELLKKAGGGTGSAPSESVVKTKEPQDKMGSVDGTRTTTRTPNARPKRTSVALTFRTKRLCEKWLDNLFMVLYNDLRLYTALKQEMSQYRSSDNTGPYKQLLFRKTGAEWEIYGDLALRLGHPEDAVVAYRLSLEQRFSARSWLRLLSISAEGVGDIHGAPPGGEKETGAGEAARIREALKAAVKLVTVLDRAFVDNTFPSPISRAIFALIGKYGYQKVHNVLISMNVPQKSYRLITRYFEYAEVFRVKGVDW
ncbi:Chs5p-Arf1p-binding proteins-domain-containing protein, partial [Zopfochytrium polystomum]